jgi:hypothetical protein
MTLSPMIVCSVDTPEGPKDYVPCLPLEHVFQHGLAPEAIVGVLLRPLESDESITPGVFARNKVFVEFMHSVIARHAPLLPGLIAEAERLFEGCVCVIDQRTPTPNDGVPPEDIVGVFEVKNGRVVPGSYQACPKHMVLSERGFFQLDADLQRCLMDDLATLSGTQNT